MNHTMEMMFIMFSLLLGCCTTSKVDGLKSQVIITGRVDPHSIKVDSGNFYAVKIDLIKDTDSTLYFWTMSCSWQDNWITENKSLLFFINCYKTLLKWSS